MRALCAIAITLQHLAEFGESISKLKETLPEYFIYKSKIEIRTDPDILLNNIIKEFKNAKINTEDGVRVDFDDHWVHFRKSNTEPIIRLYAEAGSSEEAERIAGEAMQLINELIN